MHSVIGPYRRNHLAFRPDYDRPRIPPEEMQPNCLNALAFRGTNGIALRRTPRSGVAATAAAATWSLQACNA